MYDHEEFLELLTNEALRCRLAFESFMRLLESHFVEGKRDDALAWLTIQDRYIAWIAHLQEFLKACYAQDLSVMPSKLECEVVKRAGVKKNEVSKYVDSRLDEYGALAVETVGKSELDKDIVFFPGFGESLRKVRNKYFAHLDSERIKLVLIDDFIDKHYFTAFCCYKKSFLRYAQLEGIPARNIKTLQSFRDKLLSIRDK